MSHLFARVVSPVRSISKSNLQFIIRRLLLLHDHPGHPNHLHTLHVWKLKPQPIRITYDLHWFPLWNQGWNQGTEQPSIIAFIIVELGVIYTGEHQATEIWDHFFLGDGESWVFSGKLRWQWKFNPFEDVFPYWKMRIFQPAMLGFYRRELGFHLFVFLLRHVVVTSFLPYPIRHRKWNTVDWHLIHI